MTIGFDEISCSNKDDFVKAKQIFIISPDGWSHEKQLRRLKEIFVITGYIQGAFILY